MAIQRDDFIIAQSLSKSIGLCGTVSHWGQIVDLCMYSSEWERACVVMCFIDISACFMAFLRLGLAPSPRPQLPISIVIPDQPPFSPFYELGSTLFPCFLSPARYARSCRDRSGLGTMGVCVARTVPSGRLCRVIGWQRWKVVLPTISLAFY